MFDVVGLAINSRSRSECVPFHARSFSRNHVKVRPASVDRKNLLILHAMRRIGCFYFSTVRPSYSPSPLAFSSFRFKRRTIFNLYQRVLFQWILCDYYHEFRYLGWSSLSEYFVFIFTIIECTVEIFDEFLRSLCMLTRWLALAKVP